MENTGTLQVTEPTDNEIVLTRVFEAPREAVYDAFSNPEVLKRWFGPHGWSLVTSEVDQRVGGGFRFVLEGPDGKRMGIRGVYRELEPPNRSVHVESYDDFPGESIVTSVLTEEMDRTTLTVTITFPSREIRDTVARSGMQDGAAESYDRLAELLAAERVTP